VYYIDKVLSIVLGSVGCGAAGSHSRISGGGGFSPLSLRPCVAHRSQLIPQGFVTELSGDKSYPTLVSQFPSYFSIETLFMSNGL